MEFSKKQARTLHHLTAAFCDDDGPADVIKSMAYPHHENWLRVEIAPFVFLVDGEGVPRNVTTRTPQHFG